MLALAALVLQACDNDSPAPSAATPSLEAATRTAAASWTADPVPPAEDFPVPEDDLARLGMQLFFSKTLSGDFDVACASCHMPHLGGGDALSLSVGVDAVTPAFLGPGRKIDAVRDRDPVADGGPNVPRNAQTIFNTGLYNRAMFHDGRVFVLDPTTLPGGAGQSLRTVDSDLAIEDMTLPDDFGLLEAQALFPVTSTNEMRGRHRFSNLLTNQDVRNRLVARLRGQADLDHMARNEWVELFRATFNRPADEAPEHFVTYHNLARAIAAYERSQYFVDTPWSRFMGGNADAISDAAKRGAQLFYGEPAAGGAGCARCHQGAHFTDEQFHTVGFPQIGRGKRVDGKDLGRYAVVQSPGNLHAFRTPSLLNVALTAPYGHAGTFDTLDEVVAYHLDPAQAWEEFDYGLANLDQFIGETVDYALARVLTREAVFGHTTSSTPKLSPTLPAVSLTAAQQADLVAFLRTLTDSCASDPSCFDRWVPTPEMDPDGNQLVMTLDATDGRPADPLDVFNGPPGTGTDPSTGGSTGGGSGGSSGGGSGGSGGGGSGGGGSGGFGGVLPPRAMDFFAGRTFCADRVGQTATGTGFVERSAELGIAHTHGFSVATWLIQTLEDTMQSGGVAAADFDGDCDFDLVFTGGETQGALVYRNDAADGFGLAHNLDSVTGGKLTGPAVADLDGDYRPEILFGNMRPGLLPIVTGSVTDGYSLLQAIYMANNTFGMAAGDANGDGRLDVYAGHWDNRRATDASPALLRNDITAGLVSMDAVAGTSASATPRRFQFAPGFVDIDRNGSQDLLIAADFLFSLVLKNDGSGRYTNITDRDVITDQNGMGSAIADFDGDGHLDWFVSAIRGPDDGRNWPYGMLGNRLYKGHGDGTFTDVTAQSGVVDADWAWGSCATDLNNDGHQDLFVVAGYALVPDDVLAQLLPAIALELTTTFTGFYRSVPRVWINDGTGRFEDRSSALGFTEPLNGRGVTCADFDRDGDVDLLVSQNEAAPRYYENRFAPTASHFLQIALRGPVPNTQGIGAMVEVVTTDGTQVMPVAANSNYISQNPAELHVGLGARTSASVTVHWPDGAVSTLPEVPANHFVTLSHPSLNAPKLAGGTALHDAIVRTTAWLSANPPTDADALLDLAMISDRFGLAAGTHAKTAYDAHVDGLYALMDIPAAETADLYQRVFDGSKATNTAFLTATGHNALLLPALFCREMPVAPGYAPLMAGAASSPGDALAALRALLWLRDNNCRADLLPADVAAIHLAVAPQAVTSGTHVDAGQLEALALLAAANRRDAITAEDATRVLASELPGGGWPASAGGSSADERATVHALWLLLELDEGERRFQRLVAR